MALRPVFSTPQPPPNLPNLPKTEEGLVNYLRNFALWCRNGFTDKLSSTAALPGIMLQATDAATGLPLPNVVYMLTVKATAGNPPTAPAVVLTLVAAGQGLP